MLKYAKVINEEIKLCEVGLGNNSKFYKSIGMTELDVEQSYDGSWYLKGYAPQKTLEELKQEKIQELKQARDEFKKTIFIKEGISLYDIENIQDSPYLLISLLLGIGGFTNEDLELYKSKISSIAKIYDTVKKLIENCNLKNLLDKININFIEE